MAHERVQPAGLHVAHGTLLNASVNRSPSAWANNPAEVHCSNEAAPGITLILKHTLKHPQLLLKL